MFDYLKCDRNLGPYPKNSCLRPKSGAGGLDYAAIGLDYWILDQDSSTRSLPNKIGRPIAITQYRIGLTPKQGLDSGVMGEAPRPVAEENHTGD